MEGSDRRLSIILSLNLTDWQRKMRNYL